MIAHARAPDRNGALRGADPRTLHSGQNTSGVAIAQARQLELLCLIARTLLGIDKKLGRLLHRDSAAAESHNHKEK